MSQPDERTPGDVYELYYWPGIPGRGEYVRLVLEAAGVAYRDIGREAGFEQVAELAGFAGAAAPDSPFAPPYLKLGSLMVFQTANVCAFVAERHGLAPVTEAGRWFARGVALTLEDLCREVHDTHHPIAVDLYYEDQKPEALRRAEDFHQNRLPTFLRYFDNLIKANPDPGGWLVGAGMSYCDLALFQTVAGLRYAFPRAMAGTTRQAPAVAALVEQVREDERISAYLASDRRVPFNEQGIFRHYPELDADR
jgi:glutathione S-transferase